MDRSTHLSSPPIKGAGQTELNFPMIDVLRGFAAISVVVYHVIEHFGWQSFPTTGPLLWFRIGWMGVDLFFVISGFVISLSAFALMDKLRTGYRREFAIRRIRRILPLHYLTVLVFLVLVAPEILSHGGWWWNVLSHLGFIHNLNTNWAGAINGPNWSVAVEMQFYVLILLLAPTLRSCPWWAIPTVALPVAFCWRVWVFYTVPIDETVGPYFRFWASTQLPGTLDQFAAGVLLARFVFWGGAKRLLPSLSHRLLVLGALLVAFVMVWAMLATFWPRAGFWDELGMVVLWRGFAALAFACVILAATIMTSPLLIRVTLPIRYLGTISYGIYLWHLPVILSIKSVGSFEGGTALSLTLCFTLIFASGSWHFFEKPLLARRASKHVASN